MLLTKLGYQDLCNILPTFFQRSQIRTDIQEYLEHGTEYKLLLIHKGLLICPIVLTQYNKDHYE